MWNTNNKSKIYYYQNVSYNRMIATIKIKYLMMMMMMIYHVFVKCVTCYAYACLSSNSTVRLMHTWHIYNLPLSITFRVISSTWLTAIHHSNFMRITLRIRKITITSWRSLIIMTVLLPYCTKVHVSIQEILSITLINVKIKVTWFAVVQPSTHNQQVTPGMIWWARVETLITTIISINNIITIKIVMIL